MPLFPAQSCVSLLVAAIVTRSDAGCSGNASVCDNSVTEGTSLLQQQFKVRGKTFTGPSNVFTASPTATGTAPNTLANCVDEAGKVAGVCELEDGWYEVSTPIDVNPGVTIRSQNGNDKVTIAGTKGFQKAFSACKDKRCAQDVLQVKLDDDIYQLFIERTTNDNEGIDMMVPARWPPVKGDGALHHADHVPDTPSWASLFDTGKSWSMVDYGGHDGCDTSKAGGKRCKTKGSGWLVDNGKVDKETLDAYEPGATPVPRESEAPGVLLSESIPKGMDLTNAVAVIAWGKGPSEITRVTKAGCKHNKNKFGQGSTEDPNCFSFEVDCSLSGDNSGKGGTYGTCGKRPLWKLPPKAASKCGTLCDGQEAGFVHYHLREKLEFIDQPGEWYYEKASKMLYLLPPNGVPAKDFTDGKVKLHGRVNDFGFNLKKALGRVPKEKAVTRIEGIRFIASMVGASDTSKHDGLEIFENKFLYQNAVRAPLSDPAVNPDILTPNMYFAGENMKFFNNVFKYAEGQAIEWKGEGVRFENNFLAWNGYSGTDAPFTVKLGSSGCNKVSRNTLWYNGHVSGFGWSAKMCADGKTRSSAEYNEVVGMNWGHLQNDGAAFHCPIPGQTSKFFRNWISEGVHSMGIRFDTAGTTLRNEVGKRGLIKENVIKGDLVVKGDAHQIISNTVTNKMMAILQFGLQYDMLTDAQFENNLVTKFSPRGKKCTRWKTASGTLPDESDWIDKHGQPLTLQNGDAGDVNEGQLEALKRQANFDIKTWKGSEPCETIGKAYTLRADWLDKTKESSTLCSGGELVGCAQMDFRPSTEIKFSSGAKAGAYPFEETVQNQRYWMAGRVSQYPQRPVPACMKKCAAEYVKPWGKLDSCRPVKRGPDPNFRATPRKTNGVSVAFTPAYTQIEVGVYKACGRHDLKYKVNSGSVQTIRLRRRKNVAFLQNLPEGGVVEWYVKPRCRGTSSTPGSRWKFHVLDPSVATTTTTTTTAEPCESVEQSGKYPGEALKYLNDCKLQMKKLSGLLKKGKTTMYLDVDFAGVDASSDAALQEALHDEKDAVTGGTTCPRRCK